MHTAEATSQASRSALVDGSGMKVLVDGRPLQPGPSGVGQYVLHLLSSLGSIPSLDVHALTFDFAGRRNPQLAAMRLRGLGVQEHRHRILHRKAFNGISVYLPWIPAAALGLGGFDVVHHTYFERFPRTPRRTATVSTIHDVAFLRSPALFSPINLAASRRALVQQLDSSTLLLAVSEFTKRELVELAGVDPARIRVTPLAATDPFTTDTAYPSGRDRPFVLYIGNVEPRKNLVKLVEGWCRSGLGADFDLVIAGAPLHLETDSMRSIQAATDSHVVHLGYVPTARKAALLRDAACFVYPSRYEGFGIPVLEAMRSGTPVVASDIGSLREVAGTAAVFVDPDHADAIADGIRAVLADDGLAARLRADGTARSAEFTWEGTAAATAAGYRTALELHRTIGPGR